MARGKGDLMDGRRLRSFPPSTPDRGEGNAELNGMAKSQTVFRALCRGPLGALAPLIGELPPKGLRFTPYGLLGSSDSRVEGQESEMSLGDDRSQDPERWVAAHVVRPVEGRGDDLSGRGVDDHQVGNSIAG